MTDLQFCNHGSFATMTPMTKEGADWAAENLADDALIFGGSIPIEFRYLEDIMLAARADGLVCES